MALVNGSATFAITSNLAPGPNPISVQYLGDSNYTAKTVSTTVDLAPQVILTFSPSQPTITVNQSLTQTIAITGSPNIAIATGTITLSSGSYNSGPIALSSGSASITIPANSLVVGSDTITAAYSGDTNYLASAVNETVTVNPAPNPSFVLAGTAVTLAPGASTGNTSTITLTPANGLSGSVTLTATITSSPSGAQDLPTVSFGSTSPVSIAGTAAVTATLTITTTAPSTATLVRPALPGIHWYQGGAALACLLLFGIPARRRRFRALLGMLAFLMFLAGGVISCGGGGSGGGGGGGGGTGPTNPGTTPGAYLITVTGTQGAITSSTNVNLTVQ
jgi:hypothetical protein